MKLKTEADVRRLVRESIKKQLSSKSGKGSLNEAFFGMVSLGAIGTGVMGLSEGDGMGQQSDRDPDLEGATQFNAVITQYLEDHADEIAAYYVMKHSEDGMYPVRIEDIDNMASAVAKRVVSQMNHNILPVIKNIIAMTYRQGLG